LKSKAECIGTDAQPSKRESKKKNVENIFKDYINGSDKFPLEPGRWGYLPQSLQTILRQVNADCQISKTNTNLKKNHPCLLRNGVEYSKNQSFIASISTIKYLKPNNSIPSIQETKETIIESLTLDNFIKYQNGNLVTNFNNPTAKVNTKKEIYTSSKLHTKITNDEERFYFTKAVSAFENFIEFLRNENSVIDHTYLWDIISSPNPSIFETGVNLVIFQVTENDNRLQLLCPSNHYSNQFYDSAKPTIMLMQKDEYYEPIFSCIDIENKRKSSSSADRLKVNKFFKESDKNLSNTIRAVLSEIIKPNLKNCRPLDSMPDTYKERRPLLLYNLKEQLDQNKYSISKLVINFNSKVVGVIAENKYDKKHCFVPCYPSAISDTLKDNLDYVFMTDSTLWTTYDETFDFLVKLNSKSKSKSKSNSGAVEDDDSSIPCLPKYKIVDDKDMVVGILTETNQFIQVKKILEDKILSKRNIPSLKNNNYMFNELVSSDVKIMTTNRVDHKRVDYIKKLKLETNFYNVFRNTIRIALNTTDARHVKLREEIEALLDNNGIIYTMKLKQLDDLLRKLVDDKVTFSGDDKYYETVDEVSSCTVDDVDQCNSTSKVCAISENGKCVMILPEKNLITNKPNISIYYGRIADELLRYSRIKSFMFQPQSYISFGEVGYNLKEDEVILLESILTQEYFDTLIPSVTHEYVKSNSFDDATPSVSISYDNKITVATDENKAEIACEPIIKPITSSMWKKIFPITYKEASYEYGECIFAIINTLIQTTTGKKATIQSIQLDLYQEYNKIFDNYSNQIIDILSIEGKKNLTDQLRTNNISLKQMIYNDKYFLTTFDLWLLVNRYSIPTIFISQKTLLQTKYTDFAFVGHASDADTYAFIYVPVLKTGIIPTFKLIQNTETNYNISLSEISNKVIIEQAIRQKISIEDYLRDFVKISKPVKNKPRKILDKDEYVIEDDDEE
jgi:hypothetical protein